MVVVDELPKGATGKILKRAIELPGAQPRLGSMSRFWPVARCS